MASDTVLNGRYRLVAQQGSGGMAVIYKAIDQALGRTVAVKILRPSLTSDPSFLARFRNEARSVANLAHPNIVTVHDVGSDGDTHYIVMEFIEGQDLKRIIRSEGAVNIDRTLNLSIQICAGIGFAHRAGLVHADVKPQNILVTNDDLVKVTDFGIAQALSDAAPGERQSVVWGSPHYFAPEQARGERPSPASDVYSIGIVMFELLTGRLPYTGTNQQELALAHIRDRVPMVTEFNPTVPEALSNIVYKVMSKEPAARYRMADQLRNILVSYQERWKQSGAAPGFVSVAPSPVPAPVTTPPPPAPIPQPVMTPPPPPQIIPASVPPAPPQTGYTPAAKVWPPPLQSTQGQRPVDPYATQQYGLAPNASPNPYDAQRAMPPAPMAPSPFNQPAAPYSGMAGSERLNVSQRLGQSQPYMPPPPMGSVLDAATIALAMLAFVAVACLIPLYIAVLAYR